MLKVSSFWRDFIRSTKLDSRYTSEEENNRGYSFPSSLLFHMTLTNTYISNTYTLRCVDEKVFFKSRATPFWWHYLASGEECFLDFSPKSCAYPTLVTPDPLEVKIIAILLYKNNNRPTLFCTFAIDNSSFRTTVKKKASCVSLFSVQKFLIYKVKLLSLLKRLCSMSSAIYINNLLPVTPSRHSVTKTRPYKPVQYLGMKL